MYRFSRNSLRHIPSTVFSRRQIGRKLSHLKSIINDRKWLWVKTLAPKARKIAG